MPTIASLHCCVMAALPSAEWSVELQLAEGATVADALELARQTQACMLAAERMAIDWQGAVVGIWGKVSARDARLRDGDRIEIYRPLSLDPKLGRRQRARSRRS